jgi:hypothetical protein
MATAKWRNELPERARRRADAQRDPAPAFAMTEGSFDDFDRLAVWRSGWMRVIYDLLAKRIRQLPFAGRTGRGCCALARMIVAQQL